MSSLKLDSEEETWSIEVILPFCRDSGGEKLMILWLSSEKPGYIYSTISEYIFF